MDFMSEERFVKQKYFPVICGEWCLSNPQIYGWETEYGSAEEKEKTELFRAMGWLEK